MAGKSYSSFADFFAGEKIEAKREVEVAVRYSENTAKNRLFVWNFEEEDLREFLEYFEIYKNSRINIASRTTLSGNLMRKMNAMIREGYNPIECMLYASKTINMRLQNDLELQAALAERIKDIYLKQEAETVEVIKNIINMWTWVPQIKVVIHAIGLMGDNQELFDMIMTNYADDSNYKKKVFYALLENKNLSNLERVLKIVMNLQNDDDDDTALGRAFKKEVSGFGYEGIKMIGKYYENPAITQTGASVLKRIMIQEGSLSDTDDNDEFHRKNLAYKSAKDDLAFKDFKDDCYLKYDNDAFFLARFSRSEIGDFLREAIEGNSLQAQQRNTAIISLSIIGNKGYRPAQTILDRCEARGENEYAITLANVILGNRKYVVRLVDFMCNKKDYELSGLYGLMKSSGVVNNQISRNLIQHVLEDRFEELLEDSDLYRLECLTSNFQMFRDKQLGRLFSRDILDKMQRVLVRFSENRIELSTSIIASIIETVVHDWNPNVEKAIFSLYKNSENARIQELSLKKIKERKLEAPK